MQRGRRARSGWHSRSARAAAAHVRKARRRSQCKRPVDGRRRPPGAGGLGPQLDPEIRVSAVQHGKFVDRAVIQSRVKAKGWTLKGAPLRYVNAGGQNCQGEGRRFEPGVPLQSGLESGGYAELQAFLFLASVRRRPSVRAGSAKSAKYELFLSRRSQLPCS
jgi:hypothetical protein